MSSIKRNLIYNVLLQASNIVFPLITFPYVARVLGPEGLGIANFAQNFCLYFILFSTLGIPIYGNREIAKYKEDAIKRSKLFIEISAIKLITSLLILVPYFVVVLNTPKLSTHIIIYLWGAFYILADVAAIEWFFRGMENFRYVTIRSVFVRLLYVIAIFLFVRDEQDITIYFIAVILSAVVNGIINIRYALKFIHWNFSWKELQLKKHFAPLGLLFSYFLTISLYTMLDTIMLGFLSTNAAVGFYTAAMRLVKLCLTLVTSLGEVLVPRLTSEVAKNNFEEVGRLLTNSINFVYSFGIPLMAGLYLLAPELIAIFSGNEYKSAILTLRILSLLLFIIGLANIFVVQVLIPLGKDKILVYGSLIGGIISISANFLLIPLWQHNGAAVTIVLAETFVTLFAFWFARRSLTIHLSLRKLFFHLLSVLPYILIVYYARILFSNPLLVVAMVVSFAGALFLFFQLIVLKNKLIINGLGGVLSKLRFRGT